MPKGTNNKIKKELAEVTERLDLVERRQKQHDERLSELEVTYHV